jgi:UDP-N-acetyl-D-galactosamine dehydrogenase
LIDCGLVVEKKSGLKFNVDFFAGYSPERINPRDKLYAVDRIKRLLPVQRLKEEKR